MSTLVWECLGLSLRFPLFCCISPLTLHLPPCPPGMNKSLLRMQLPFLQLLLGSIPKPHLCAGCKLPVGDEAIMCCFTSLPFPNQCYPHKPYLRVCGAAYHPQCIKVGPSFWLHHKDNCRLMYPKGAAAPRFICKACAVWMELGQELEPEIHALCPTMEDNIHILCLEYICYMDVTHSWAPLMHKGYGSNLCWLHLFNMPLSMEKPPHG